MAQLFGRSVTVVVGSLLIKGLRVQFKAKKSTKKEPNELELVIYNLSETSRASLQAKGTRIIVEAGYGETSAQIFSGDSRLIDHQHEGPNWVTKVQCADGERAYLYARVNESFRAGTTVANVFARVAEATGLDAVDAVATVRRTVTEQFTRGYTARGRASAEIDRLLKNRGLEWSIQDGRLQVVAPGVAITTQAVLLSPSTGLIGSPTHGTPAKKGKAQTLKVKSLLQPGLRPAAKIRIESAATNGDFRVETVIHQGDSLGQDWYSEVEALPV